MFIGKGKGKGGTGQGNGDPGDGDPNREYKEGDGKGKGKGKGKGPAKFDKIGDKKDLKVFKSVEYKIPEDFRGKVRSSMKPMQIREKSMTQEVQSEVGRWGEEFAFQYLKATETRENAQVIWINGVEETGQPYDVCIDLGDGEMEYYEVKATKTGDKHYFEMSYREWDFAMKRGPAYTILRVMNAGSTERASVVGINNPYSQWKFKELGIAVAL